ncbi:hypothetical protein NDN08_000878 [Rhodosorus marinus]|uniref:Aspartoacylase n=1 Tax=Rhodosorus marinus TaxID=101924 RepID=A0AAV8UTD9_9RHOD|nr:hypothetical protein NDN08_000878 [Rhodosorus marinus]
MWEGRWLDVSSPVRRVAIVGGTHGNELNGVYIQRALKMAGVRGEGFDVVMLEANPEAAKLNRRYVEEDLNRCFKVEDLENPGRTSLEQNRAREINEILGPKKSKTPRADFVIDLHGTTSNSGTALMMHPKDSFSHALAAHLQHLDPSVRICHWFDSESPTLPSVGRSGLTFEVGPISWGVVEPELYSNSLRLIQAALSYIAAHNSFVEGSSQLQTESCSVDAYARIRPVSFPRYESGEFQGDLQAMLHPNLHGNDFSPLAIGDPIFKRWDGTDIYFDGPEEGEDLTFFFANEAAYYEKNVAFVLARTRKLTIQRLKLS